jgi:hypothetical protein
MARNITGFNPYAPTEQPAQFVGGKGVPSGLQTRQYSEPLGPPAPQPWQKSVKTGKKINPETGEPVSEYTAGEVEVSASQPSVRDELYGGPWGRMRGPLDVTHMSREDISQLQDDYYKRRIIRSAEAPQAGDTLEVPFTAYRKDIIASNPEFFQERTPTPMAVLASLPREVQDSLRAKLKRKEFSEDDFDTAVKENIAAGTLGSFVDKVEKYALSKTKPTKNMAKEKPKRKK